MSDFLNINPEGITSPYAKNARTPRAVITVNGISAKFYELSITTTTFYLADTFSVELSLNGQSPDLTLNYWASVENFNVKIYVGYPPDPDNFSSSDLELLIEGDVDDIEIDLGSARISMSGRDYTSRFLDNKTTEKFSNQTASQIVTMFASKQGLTPVVTQTSTPVGVYYSQQQVLLTSEITQWDLMTFLAQQEDFALFVQRSNLIFEPRPDDTNVKNPYVIPYQPPSSENGSPTIGAVSLVVSRSMTLASDAQVTVRVPFGTKTGRGFSVTSKTSRRAGAKINGAPQPSRKVQKYVFTKPGLNQEQALQFANQRLKEITSHELRISAMKAADNFLRKDSLIQITGTNTPIDQYYYADQVTRTISINNFDMEISAKNHSVDSQVNLSTGGATPNDDVTELPEIFE